MTYLLPIPDHQGIEDMKQLYRERFGRKISDEEAAEVLGRVMRFIYLLSELADQMKKEDQSEQPGEQQ
jgi:hypothetical protein